MKNQNNEKKFKKISIVRISVMVLLVLLSLIMINSYNKLGYVKPWLYLLLSSILLIILSLCLIFKEKLNKYINNHKAFQVYDISTFTCFIVLIFMFFNTFILSFTTVDGSSMEPTLYENDRVVVTSLFYKPKTNDIIAFDSTNYDIDTHDYLCKRIIATSGDNIKTIKDGSNYDVYVNDELTLSEIPFYRYETMITYLGDGSHNDLILDENLNVKEGYSIIIGDNLTYSIDSRDFGAVKNEDILGKVIFRYFSRHGKIKVVR